MPTPEVQEVLDRLGRLETRCRWLQRALVAAVALLVLAPAALTYARSTTWYQKRRVVKAGSYVLVDEDGRRRGSFNNKKGGLHGMRINDDKGNMRILLVVDADGKPSLTLFDGDPPRPVFRAP